MSVAESFRELMNAAAAKNKIVAKHKGFDPNVYSSEAELRQALFDLGSTIGKEMNDAGLSAKDVPDEVVKLMRFFSTVNPEPEVFECKEPITGIKLNFNQIAGLKDVKLQLSINYIQPFVYPKLFPSLAKGTLLYGPPGTGKTLLAKAATAEIKNVAYYALSPAELKGKYEGETEKNIRSVFKCAAQVIGPKYKFAIIFFDEFDSIAGKRGEDASMVRSVNSLLQAMDGIESSPNVSVLAATNYPWMLDDAILRRFNTRIFVDLPDPEAIEYLIRQELAKVYSNPNLSEKEKLDSIRKGTKEKNKSGFALGAPYITNIAIYGGFKGPAPRFYGLGGNKQDKYVDDDYVAKLVDSFGPTPAGKAIINEVKSNKDVDVGDSRLNVPHIFGFSPSDITKVMQESVKYAAVRALQGDAIKKKGAGWTGEYWFAVREDQLKEGEEPTPIDDVPVNERDLVINFDIRQSDVEQAMKNLPSTVDNVKYLELLKYAKQG